MCFAVNFLQPQLTFTYLMYFGTKKNEFLIGKCSSQEYAPSIWNEHRIPVKIFEGLTRSDFVLNYQLYLSLQLIRSVVEEIYFSPPHICASKPIEAGFKCKQALVC